LETQKHGPQEAGGPERSASDVEDVLLEAEAETKSRKTERHKCQSPAYLMISLLLAGLVAICRLMGVI
jgi:hypothetical protein